MSQNRYDVGTVAASDVATVAASDVATVAPSVVATVARELIRGIMSMAVLYSNTEDLLKTAELEPDYSAQQKDRLKVLMFHLESKLLSFFYPTLGFEQNVELRQRVLPSQTKKKLTQITQQVIHDTVVYKLRAMDEPKQIETMETILETIALEWAQQVDFDVFQNFVGRFVRGFLGKKWNIEIDHAFRTIVHPSKLRFRDLIVNHLFADENVRWFTAPHRVT